MQFTAEEYYRAGIERMRQARELYKQEDGNYALVMYTAGLAVECMLRAFRYRQDASFEGRHDLHELLKASRLLQIDEEYVRRRRQADEKIVESTRKVREAMNEVAALWNNNLRFASEDRLRGHLKQLKKDRGVKGDVLKKNAKDILDHALVIINRGELLWNSGIEL